ncbi:MAG: hypothetical protein FWC86_05645, partial [Coriobacteriia bacterium]|nr:hypothetical protein [Coriobacteriia bacterium]
LYERYPVLSGSVNPINGFTLTVPPNAVPWTAFYQVIITYITDINPSDIPQQGEPSVVFGNDIYFQFPDGGPGIEGGAQVPIIADKVNMSKTTSGICGRPDLSPAGPNGELYYVDYTVTIEVPAGLQGQPLYLYDNLGLSGSANVVNIPEFTSISAEGSEVAGTSLQHTSAIRYNYPPTTNAWRMFFGTEDDALSSGWGWQYNEPITLTLEYRSWLDQAAVNNLKAGRQLQNTVYLINGTDAPSLGTLGNAVGSTNVTDLWPIVKSVQRTENPALFNYTVAIKGNYSNRAASLLEGRSPIFADTFDSRLTYVPNSFYMVNTNAPGYYYVHNGDVAVASGGLKAELNDGLWTRYQDQYPDGINPQSATSDWFEADYTYEAHYQLVLGSAYLETAEVISLVNTAAIEVDPGACKFEASQSVNYVESRLSKTMNPLSSGSDLVNVEIIINPDGSIVFSDGVNTPPQTVVASDYLRNLVLFVDSVTFYTQTQDATTGVWDGKWVAISTPPASMNDRTEWSTNPVVPPAPPAGVIADGQVDFVIPNAQPVKITYQVRVTLPPGEMDTISNEIHIFGESAGDSNDNYVVGGGGVGVGGDKLNLRVFKVDQEGASLPDATFSLYVTDIENNIFSPPGGLPVAKTITGSGGETIDFGLVYVAGPNPPALEASVTTDQNGIALFGDNEWLTSDTGFDLLYLLVETGVPAGYMANNENTYFVLNPNIDVGTIDYVETLVEEGIDQATDFVRVENTALGAMTIQKTFEGISDVLINQELQNLQISISGPGNFERTIGLQEILDNPNGILIENLVPGAYSVEETGAEITSLVLSTNPSLPYSYDVEPGSTGEIAVVIINTYTPEAVEPTPVDLRINKIIEGLSESEIAEGLRNLEIVIAGPGINSEVVFNLLDILVGPMVIENAAPGRYAISERNADVAGFSLETSPSLPRIFELLPNDSGYVEFDLYNVYTELPPVPPPPTPTTPTVPITPTVPSPPGDAGKGPITGDMLKGANLALVLLALLAIATSITGLHRLKEGEEENS